MSAGHLSIFAGIEGKVTHRLGCGEYQSNYLCFKVVTDLKPGIPLRRVEVLSIDEDAFALTIVFQVKPWSDGRETDSL